MENYNVVYICFGCIAMKYDPRFSENYNKLMMVFRLISFQVGETGPERFLLSIFEQAIRDAFSNIHVDDVNSARRYLLHDLRHIQALGIEPSWVRKLFIKVGVFDALSEVKKVRKNVRFHGDGLKNAGF